MLLKKPHVMDWTVLKMSSHVSVGSDITALPCIYFLMSDCDQGKDKMFVRLGLDKIEFLQSHDNQEIYQKAFDLIERYFGVEDEDSSLAPQVDQANQQFLFPQQEAPMEGFQL